MWLPLPSVPFLELKGTSKTPYKTVNFGMLLNVTIYVLDCGFEF